MLNKKFARKKCLNCVACTQWIFVILLLPNSTSDYYILLIKAISFFFAARSISLLCSEFNLKNHLFVSWNLSLMLRNSIHLKRLIKTSMCHAHVLAMHRPVGWEFNTLNSEFLSAEKFHYCDILCGFVLDHLLCLGFQ